MAVNLATTTSIVDYLKGVGQPSDFSYRSRLAAQYGITNYTGTATQNTQLLNILRSAAAPTVAPIVSPAVAAPSPITTPSFVSGPSVSFPSIVPTIQPQISAGIAPTAYTGVSLVDFLRSTGQPSDFESRKSLAAQFGIANYTGSASQNLRLLELLRGSVVQPTLSPELIPFFSQLNPQGVAVPSGWNLVRPSLPGQGQAGAQVRDPQGNLYEVVATPGGGLAHRLIERSGLGVQAQQALQPTGENALVQNLPPELRSLYDVLKQQLEELRRRGLVINPGVAITPEKVAEFMAQARNEINPFFRNQLSIAREQFLRELGFGAEEIRAAEEEAELGYRRQLRELIGGLAERGFALSGLRQREERELAETTQQRLAGQRRRLQFQAGTSAREFARRFGTANVPGFTIPLAPRVLAGEEKFERPAGQTALYELSPDVFSGITGEQSFLEQQALQRRAAELESGYLQQQQLNQLRSLTL